MFIVWGKKTVRRRLGFVADFCPICRSPQAFELQRVGSAGHVYYISAGQGELLGFERTCLSCGTSLEAHPERYAAPEKRVQTLKELVRRTYPTLQADLQERLAFEEQIQRDPGSLSAEDRRACIRQPFLLMSPRVERRFASTKIDLGVGLAIFGALSLLSIGPALFHAVAPDKDEFGVLVSLGLGAGLVGWQMLASGRRFMQHQILPHLAGALRPLRPTEREITAVLREMKQSGHKMGAKLQATDVIARIKGQPVAGARRASTA